MSDGMNRVSGRIESMATESKEFVRDHALPAALIAFGLGLAAGLAVASLLADASPRQTTVTQRLGQQLLDALSAVVPDALAKK